MERGLSRLVDGLNRKPVVPSRPVPSRLVSSRLVWSGRVGGGPRPASRDDRRVPPRSIDYRAESCLVPGDQFRERPRVTTTVGLPVGSCRLQCFIGRALFHPGIRIRCRCLRPFDRPLCHAPPASAAAHSPRKVSDKGFDKRRTVDIYEIQREVHWLRLV